MGALPWQVKALIPPEREEAFREALGTEPDPGGRTVESMVVSAFQDFADSELFVRVIVLNPSYAVPPGQTMNEQQARLARWLPAHWVFDPSRMMLMWVKGVRFGGLNKNIQLPVGQAPLLIGPCSPARVSESLSAWRACARWLDSGQLWVFTLPRQPKQRCRR